MDDQIVCSFHVVLKTDYIGRGGSYIILFTNNNNTDICRSSISQVIAKEMGKILDKASFRMCITNQP